MAADRAQKLVAMQIFRELEEQLFKVYPVRIRIIGDFIALEGTVEVKPTGDYQAFRKRYLGD